MVLEASANEQSLSTFDRKYILRKTTQQSTIKLYIRKPRCLLLSRVITFLLTESLLAVGQQQLLHKTKRRFDRLRRSGRQSFNI